MNVESLAKLRQIWERKEFEEFIKSFRNWLLEKIISWENEWMFEKTKTPLDVLVGQAKIIDSLFAEFDEMQRKFNIERAREIQQEATIPVAK